MCGIFGVVNTTNFNYSLFSGYFKDALIAGQVRGRDGTGIYQIESSTNPTVYLGKTQHDGNFTSDIVKGSNLPHMISDVDRCMLSIGHHRAATSGVISDKTAHPFLFSREDKSEFVGVHNGTLTKFGQQAKDMKDYAVDSEYLMHRMADEGVAAALADVQGAVATVAYDSAKPDKFYMYSNGERPLHFAFCKYAPGRMLIASEAEMLYWLAKRNKIDIAEDAIYKCVANRLYTFNTKEGMLRDYETEDLKSVKTYSGISQGGYPPSAAWDKYDDVEWDFMTERDSWMGHGRNSYTPLPHLGNAVKLLVQSLMNKKGTATPTTVETAYSFLTTSLPEPTSKQEDKPRVIPSEVQCLKDSVNIKVGTEVIFDKDLFYPNTHGKNGTLTGLVTIPGNDTDLFSAVIKDVSEEQVALFPASGFTRALGAYLEQMPNVDGLELNIVCAKHLKETPARISTVEKQKETASA